MDLQTRSGLPEPSLTREVSDQQSADGRCVPILVCERDEALPLRYSGYQSRGSGADQASGRGRASRRTAAGSRTTWPIGSRL